MGLPRSAVSNKTAAIGATSLALGVAYQVVWPEQTPVGAALFLIASYLVPVALFETCYNKVHLRKSTGLKWEKVGPPNRRRVAIKLVGFMAVLAAIALIHSVFRIYAYDRFVYPIVAIIVLAPFLLPIVIVYFYEVDRRMEDPNDGYFEFGALVLRLNPHANWTLLRDFALGWAIKGLFLPIMFAYLALNMPGLSQDMPLIYGSPVEKAVYLAKLLIVMELTIVVVGYSMTLRLFDSHIRSPNKLLGAWVVTLICYEPFNRLASGQIYSYNTGRSWTDVIDNYPLLVWPWIVMILLSYIFWMWSTAIFGLRWSNLTHRGIITNGPYRYTKHPDYVAKSCFFWLTAAPFLTAFNLWQAVTASLALLVVNAVYFGRARMEEKHLSDDPTYVAYALEMNRRSIFAPLTPYFPQLAYRMPDEVAVTLRKSGDLPDASAQYQS